MEPIIFISDLHLQEEQPDMTALFLRFMDHEARHAKALYILGDLFELWIGDDHLSDFNQTILTALRTATARGLSVYFTHGNRDFLLGKKSLNFTGCQLLPEAYVANIGGIPTLLMHGDTLCTDDVAYLKFRKKSRHWLVQKLFLLMPLKQRLAIAARGRKASQVHTANTPSHIMDVNQNTVETVMNKYGVRHLIHGHTHREATHHFQLNGHPATRTVLGAWHERGSALICYPDGENELITL
jgi:UDP-2,3-diacylglucosamine hydrolase